MTNSLEFRPRTRRRRVRALQSTEERMLVLVLISIVVLFVCCTTPAAVLSVLYSVKLNDHLGFQVSQQTYIQFIINFVHDFKLLSPQVFRAVANNLELLNFALNFYIYCLCRCFVSQQLSSKQQEGQLWPHVRNLTLF